MSFAPIAIVGRACLLPGADTPEQLWQAVRDGANLLSAVDPDRWGVSRRDIMRAGADDTDPDRTSSDRGGYVRGFAQLFDPCGFLLPPQQVRQLDPLVQWLLHVSRGALNNAGISDVARAGAVVGNLSFPSESMSYYAARQWLGDELANAAGLMEVEASNRFMSGLPAHLLAQALGLGEAAYCLDAACASSLVALKSACDRLHDGAADTMLAGAVCRADDLFIHVGFCALKALSPSAQSRPFHRAADGLLPAEGAGMLVLQRLPDAEQQGRHIYGVIRGIGLSNDGRGQGLLAPSAHGQARAMRLAYAQAGLSPDSIDYVECHATGTPTGDACELRSMAAVFGHSSGPAGGANGTATAAGLSRANQLPIGSLKGNLGHLITAAGVASLMKVLAAFEEQLLPPTMALHGEGLPLLKELPFRVVEKAEPWLPRSDGSPRRAGVSAFGFGGNNAHVVVEEYLGKGTVTAPTKVVSSDVAAHGAAAGDIAVVALVQRQLASGEEITLPLSRLRFPPSDLKQTLPQQLLMLAAAGEALASIEALPTTSTGVFVGMACDPNVARYGARWRMPRWARRWGSHDTDFIARARDAFAAPLTAAGVLGTMPNIVANRINSSFDLGGQSTTVSAEELSGVRALTMARRALAAGEIDAALVGAVDFGSDPVHRAALHTLVGDNAPAGVDAAVAMVLMRVDDARAAGHPVIAVLPHAAGAAVAGGNTSGHHPPRQEPLPSLLTNPHGAHAASGLWQLAQALRTGQTGMITITALGGASMQVHIVTGEVSWEEVARAAAADTNDRVLSMGGVAAQPVLPSWPSAAEEATVAPLLPPQPRHRVAGAGGSPQRMLPAPALERLLPVEPPGKFAPQQPTAPRSNLSTVSPAPTATSTSMPNHNVSNRSVSHRQAPVQAPTAATMPTTANQGALNAPPMPSQNSAAVCTMVAQQRAQLAKLHQQFLAQQGAVHQHFLASRVRQQQQLLNLAAHMPTSIALPHVPMSVSAPPAPRHAASHTPAVPTNHVPATEPAPSLPGFRLDREQLKVHAGGAISTIFGEAFAGQDGYARQVRMPLPPLLLADRVTGIDAEPNVLGTGTIWTETDVTADAWYLHRGRMPAGLMIEAGQADLMLISYMGIDRYNQSERVYRLLGCELTYHGELPQPGDTMAYDIHVDGHAQQGDVRLFFFHYDCRVAGQLRLSVRHGQAGFFSDAELEASAGVLWAAEEAEPCDNARLELPENVTTRRAFNSQQLRAFAAGKVFECFGAGFEKCCTHTRSPGTAQGRMLLIDEVTHFEPHGGPWGRGYLRAIDTIEEDDWFFGGHFYNDPCMPGTLMFEGCLQTMVFYLAALGFTCDRDGWRFEPMPGEAFKMLCRGQVLPTSKNLVYEVFVEEVVGGATPRLYADLLCTIDGRKAFHCRRMALRMVPDWPMKEIIANNPGMLSQVAAPVAGYDGFRFDHASLLACAWGPPSHAFGPIYRRFDSPRNVARLPSPPYHFMTRVTHVDGRPGKLEPDQTCVVAYDIPQDVWYFSDNGTKVMPFCVLLEAALQPCGWLASYVGSALSSDTDLAFRNLDGTGTLHCDVLPDCGTLTTRATITNISSSAGMIIESFTVECHLGDTLVYDMTTVFGFFPQQALDNQSGLPIPKEHQGALAEASERSVDLAQRPPRYCCGSARLCAPSLLMIDRVTGIWPAGGNSGKGRYRAEKDIAPDEWFLKAHFFQDPVQPGSLGIEAMLQLLQFAMLDRGMDEGMQQPRFEAIATGKPLTWKYRGQVRVHNRKVHTLIDIVATGEDELGRYAIATAALYVDGMRIYEASNLAMRLVEDKRATPRTAGGNNPKDAATREGPRPAPTEGLRETLDPAKDVWLRDHCPTFTVPALPLMSMVDRLAAAAAARAPALVVVGLDQVQVARWLALSEPVELLTVATEHGHNTFVATLSAWRTAARAELSRFEVVASGNVQLASEYAAPAALAWAPLAPLRDGAEVEIPYRTGQLFHGPAFHKLLRLVLGKNGASTWLAADAQDVPRGLLNQLLLDAATHGIPHDRLSLWCDHIGDDVVAYPYRIENMQLFGEAPRQGVVRCEARFVALDEQRRFARIRLYLFAEGELWMRCELVEVLLPKGPLGAAPPQQRRAFLRDRQHVAGLTLARQYNGESRLSLAEVKASNWLPTTIETLYRIAPDADVTTAVAIKDHVGQAQALHPQNIDPCDGGARLRHRPLWLQPLSIDRAGDDVCVRDAAPARFDLQPVESYWSRTFGVGRWPVEDLYYGLIRRFVNKVELADAAAFEALRGRSLLYLANHQVAIESLLFSIIASGLSQVPTVTLAKEEHRGTWLGLLIKLCFAYPGVVDPQVITYFDRSNPSSLAQIIGDLAQQMLSPGKSVMVHVEGTRSLHCRTPVIKMTSAFIDMALHTRAPIVPVRFVGGLPREPLSERIEFPLAMGKQDIYIGRPIEPEVFEALPYKERKAVVIEQLNALGPSNEEEQPLPGDDAFAAAVAAHQAHTGASHEHATLWQVLRELDNPGAEVQRLLAAADAGKLQLDGSAKDAWLGELAQRLVPSGWGH